MLLLPNTFDLYENKFGKIVILLLSIFSSSCLLIDDAPVIVLQKINENYYVLQDQTGTYDLQIGYSIKEEKDGFQILASNCIDFYYGRDTIMFTKGSPKKEYTLYYIIPIDSKQKTPYARDPIEVKEN